MKMFNKFPNKNVGKPGVLRLWGGGLISSAAFVAALAGLFDDVRAEQKLWNCNTWDWGFNNFPPTLTALGREACRLGAPYPLCFFEPNSDDWVMPVPALPDCPGILLDCSGACPSTVRLCKALFNEPVTLINFWDCPEDQRAFLDGWVYGYLEEFNSGGFGKDCPAAVEPPRFNSWIVGASVALGVLGWGLFIGGYNKSKSRTAVLKINGL